MDFIEYYANQAGGNNSGVFYGSPRQKGHGLGGVFRSLYRYMMPLFKSHALPVLKKSVKSVGSEALRAATNIGIDALKGENLKDSAKNNIEIAMQNLHNKAQSKLQSGEGMKKSFVREKYIKKR